MDTKQHIDLWKHILTTENNTRDTLPSEKVQRALEKDEIEKGKRGEKDRAAAVSTHIKSVFERQHYRWSKWVRTNNADDWYFFNTGAYLSTWKRAEEEKAAGDREKQHYSPDARP